jgi:hypothetical protein
MYYNRGMPIDRQVEPTSFDKLKQLILFIAKEGEGDPRLGATKLNKILYFADARAYLELGKPISGAIYQHLPEGPAPKALIPARRELLDEGAIELESVRYLTQVQQRIKVKTEPNLKVFDDAELRIIREVIHEFWLKNAKEVSDLSHEEWAWKLTEDGEDIPWELAWLSSEALTLEQVEFGQNLWPELNARA